MYYVVKVNNNNIRLADTYFDSIQSKPSVVGITSASLGTISPINPPISLYKDSVVTFDLSDSSLSYSKQGTLYSAFDFNLYTDKNFTKLWNKSSDSTIFEFLKDGKVGTVGAKATLTVNENIPQILYYKLNVLEESSIPDVKERISTDSEVVSGSEIKTKESLYNGKHTIESPTPEDLSLVIDKLKNQL